MINNNVIIKAENLGIKFKLTKFNRSSINDFLKDAFLLNNRNNLRNKKDFWAIKNLNFEIQKGEIIGVVGKNGSGKSTLLKLISGIYSPSQGNIEVRGSVSSLLQLNTGLRKDLTGLENIYLVGVITGFTEKQIENVLNEIISFSELQDFIYQPVKSYSSGMKARLGFSISVFLRRDIILLDEILGVGDYIFREKSKSKLLEIINNHETTIFLVSHSEDTINRYTTKTMWINEGKLEIFGETTEVMNLYLNQK